jgi:hypothetical protein
VKNLSLGRLFAVSILVAALNVALPFLLLAKFSIEVDELCLHVGLCLAGIWLFLTVLALSAHGRRGLWLLIGLPFALFPVWLNLFFWGYINGAI